MADLSSYAGKRCVVTGGASGQGAETARIVGERGGDVYILDVKEPTVAGTFVRCDLSDAAGIDAAVDQIDAPVHALFNCAGLPMTFTPMQIVDVNFLGLRHLTERVIPLMGPGSAISSISSIGGMGWMEAMGAIKELLAIADFAAGHAWAEANPDTIVDGYSFSKAAVIVYTMARCPSLARQGIRITCISPGAVDTPMLPDFVKAAGEEAVAGVSAVAGRPSRPEEQAQVLAFLNSDAASYVSGANIFVDGGFSGAIYAAGVEVAVPART